MAPQHSKAFLELRGFLLRAEPATLTTLTRLVRRGDGAGAADQRGGLGGPACVRLAMRRRS